MRKHVFFFFLFDILARMAGLLLVDATIIRVISKKLNSAIYMKYMYYRSIEKDS